MSTETIVFPETSKEEWVNILTKELKGAPIETLHKYDEVEEIAFNSYMHQSDKSEPFSAPGRAPFVRGVKADSNDWVIACSVYLRDNQTDEEANKFILDQLMKGSTGIYMIAETDRELNFEVILKEVGLQYVYTSFEARNQSQARVFNDYLGQNPGSLVYANHAISVNAYRAQQSGCNAVQELVVALLEGHEQLVNLLDAGKSIDEACEKAQVVFGVGTKYLIETAKFRAFRWCWSTLISAYGPASENAKYARVVAKTGFTHLSLKDPYTNLLRQTTQAMSALNGGVDELVIQPYDAYSTHFNPVFSQRMATNISLLLQEESFFAKVSDVSGGAYAIDYFTKTLAENAWKLFKAMEEKGGLANPEVRTALTAMIADKANLRKQRILEKQDKLIGINIFPNPKTEEGSWTTVPNGYNDLPTLLLDTVI